MTTATFQIWRGGESGGGLKDFTTTVTEGMVVLDAVHQIQAEQANDLAVRWNCKAGKCGSCSAEVNGNPRLMCMTRLNQLDLSTPVTVEPMRTFPLVKDLVTDVSWNYEVKKRIKPFKPRKPDAADGTWRMQQEDIDRVQHHHAVRHLGLERLVGSIAFRLGSPDLEGCGTHDFCSSMTSFK